MISTMNSGSTLDGWIMVMISSAACIAGAAVVFIDSFWKRPEGSLLESRPFLAGSMALASGVLLFSSLTVLLPEARERLDSDAAAYCCFFGGALFTLLLTRFIHWCTPDAIHACGASATCTESEEASEDERCALTSAPHHHPHAHPPPHHHHNHSHNHNHTHHHHDAEYGSLGDTHFRFHPAAETDLDQKRFFSIGIQTAIAICVHKFPEGLIMFVSSQASVSLGISVAAAMSIHNLTEGFMIAYPLYFALRSRKLAFAYASILGGLSQPIGAVLGLLALRNVRREQEDLLFGVTFGLVSGMMSFITVQSMLPQALRADANTQHVLFFFFLGIFLVGLTSVLETL